MGTEVLESVASWIGAAEYVTALTGAGLSTDSGIPDYRGPQGLWTKDPEAEKLSSLQHYMADPAVRVRAWKARVSHPAWNAAPNAGHRALVDLEKKGKLQTLVTQNVDGLHQLAGTSRAILIEIHGSMREVVCMSCGERSAMKAAVERVMAGENDPPCLSCGGILKSATISFGQNLVARDLNRAAAAAASCDVFLAIGTSLQVHPVAALPRLAQDVGAKLVIFNRGATPYDEVADAVGDDPLSDVLPALAAMV